MPFGKGTVLMKICVTSQGGDLDAQVDPRFGRARFFVFYDDESRQFEAMDNSSNVNAAGGAGVQSATTVAEQGCQWVLSGHIGPKAMSVLTAAGVKVAVGASGTVSEALEAFRNGQLSEVAEADKPTRW